MTRREGGALAGAWVLSAAFAVVGGCTGTRGAPVEAPVELVIEPVDKLADAGLLAPDERDAAMCVLTLTAGPLEKGSRGCYLDEHIDGAGGVLRYACSGDGQAEATFGDYRYAGRIVSGDVELELTGEIDWEDGCLWGTRAVITGTVLRAAGEPTFDDLSWRYVDHVIRGSPCSGVCTASATIGVLATNDASRARGVDDDD